MTKEEKICWLKKAINSEQYLERAIYFLAQEMILIFYQVML
ncbi:MAG TPA: hypothetical protein PK520_08840 [Exilispira sp.]|jgi:hypothetical protein|nr:hypothetical protein [Exilispira sp.]HOV46782.1 hypothetical protein [Exilispira sp.]HPB48634.1 hypothetical protein [Exilispira sp.]HPO60025.1 hypothetical protein [Exilispira sp.]HQM89881.1 hypothetical protein [Exilispira sp.]